MRRIALVLRKKQSSWISCRSITRNLVRSYELAFPGQELRHFHQDESMSLYDVHREAERLSAFAPDLVAFVEHAPHPAPLLRALSEKADSSPRILIHVFGDFTLKPAEWLGVSDVLGKARARFVCASEKQAELIRSFVRGAKGVVGRIPYPVEREQYSFRPGEHQRIRDRLGYRPEDSFFVYAGRISLQKNVVDLVHSFVAYLKQINPHAHLGLAGPVDDIGIPYLGVENPNGFYLSSLMRVLSEQVPAEFRDHIRYFGNLPSQRLSELYQACDTYVSLSTHNDEDFGMAPAEALCSGAPVILTDWAGFSSFKDVKGGVRALLPVEISKSRILPKPSDCIRAFLASSADRLAEGQRSEISEAALSYCSVESVAAKLSEFVLAEGAAFTGFSDQFLKFTQAFRARSDAPFNLSTFSPFYREAYAPYF